MSTDTHPLETNVVIHTKDTPLVSHDTDSDINVPNLSLPQLFILFLWFGLRAWGGPVPQIAMFKQQLVEEEKWISIDRFHRVLSVYQILPGPEATELCCYFGLLARGRIGSVIAGFAFVLPGFLMMLMLTRLYFSIGLEQAWFQASMKGIQCAVTAMVFRAVHKIGEHALINTDTGQVSYYLIFISLFSLWQSVIGVNFLLTLVGSGALYLLAMEMMSESRRVQLCLVLVFIFYLFSWVAAIFIWKYYSTASDEVEDSRPHSSLLLENLFQEKSLGAIFLLGLMSGCLTFGGAYTAIPFIQYYAVYIGGWLTNDEFLRGIALSSIIPAPLVIFATFVGYSAGRLMGALLMTFGIFLPAFTFTLVGHNIFEKLVQMRSLQLFLGGTTAAIVGLISQSAFGIAKDALPNPASVFLFFLSLGSLYYFNDKSVTFVVISTAAVAGLVLFEDEIEI